MKRALFNILFVLYVLTCGAQGVIVNAPSHVSTGENFRLSYVISTQDVGDIHLGNIPEALELITGPYRSSQSSYQVINGHASSSSSTTFTYILCATKGGTYKIPSASVVVNGHRYTSKPVQIRVSGRAVAGGSGSRMHNDASDQPRLRSAGSAISGKDLFIKVSASKNKVYEQEPVVLTYKVYTLVDLNELKGDMPDLTGFHTLEVPLPQQKSFHIENYNGRPYRCVTWSQYIMYPQMHGALKIPSIVFKGSVVQQNRNVDPLEAFLNGGSAYVEVKKNIVAPGLTLNVLPLPAKPSNFSGGVGVFNVSAQLNKTEIRANDPFTLRVVVSGRGNMKLLKKPVVNFPKDFDKYDPKITDKTKITGNGLEGNMIYDFIVVPRNRGSYTIPPIEFVYFDTNTNSYKTVKTQSFNIVVEKGTGNASSVTDYTDGLKDQDIRQIKEGDAEIQNMDNLFFNSFGYWIVMLVITVLAMGLIYFGRRYSSVSSSASRRVKGANRIALKRLRKADELMLHGDKSRFYEEVLKALWGYIEEKFNIPSGKLTRESVQRLLSENGVDQELISKFVGIIDDCEMARYSQSSIENNMNEIFEDSMNVIIAVEDALKGGKKRTTGKFFALLLLVCIAMPAYSITKENADAEYRSGNYQQAIKDYTELLKAGESSVLYYNLGNAYYRSDNITYAILNYERALMLSPADKDIQVNLQIAQSKTIDKITPEPQMFLVQWLNSVVNLMNVDSWAKVSVFCLILAFVLLGVYLCSDRVVVRKFGFFASMLFFIIVVMAISCAYSQKNQLEKRKCAIVIAPSVQLKKVPDAKGANATVVHEGTKVEIIDNTLKDWKHVRLGDNREGWLLVSQIERI